MHCKHNHAPCLPTNLELLATQHQQTLLGHQSDVSNRLTNRNVPLSSPVTNMSITPPFSATADPKPQLSQENSTTLQAVTQGTAVSPTTDGSEPWQLQYYDPPTHDIIKQAKQFSHCDAMSINPFPVGTNFSVKAIMYIDKVIAERQSQGLLISKGKPSILKYTGPYI